MAQLSGTTNNALIGNPTIIDYSIPTNLDITKNTVQVNIIRTELKTNTVHVSLMRLVSIFHRKRKDSMFDRKQQDVTVYSRRAKKQRGSASGGNNSCYSDCHRITVLLHKHEADSFLSTSTPRLTRIHNMERYIHYATGEEVLSRVADLSSHQEVSMSRDCRVSFTD